MIYLSAARHPPEEIEKRRTDDVRGRVFWQRVRVWRVCVVAGQCVVVSKGTPGQLFPSLSSCTPPSLTSLICPKSSPHSSMLNVGSPCPLSLASSFDTKKYQHGLTPNFPGALRTPTQSPELSSGSLQMQRRLWEKNVGIARGPSLVDVPWCVCWGERVVSNEALWVPYM